MASLISKSMDRKFMCFLLLLLIVSCSGTGYGHGKNMGKQGASKHLGSRKLSEKKTSSNSTVAKPTDIGVGTTTPPTPYITTPTTPTVTPTTPTVTPTTPTINPPTTPVTTPTTPVPTPTTSGQSWCVARTNVPDKSLQTALDYACGLGGADCRATLKGGQCYEPNTLAAHASYAFNNYFQKNNMAPGTCDFGGNAMLTQTNPSYGTCIYPTGSSTSTPTTPGITPTTPTTPGITPTTPTTPGITPTTPTTTPVYNSSTPGGIITTPPGGIITTPPGITGGIPSLGPASSFNTTYSGSSSTLKYLGSSFAFLMPVSVAVILG